MLIRDRILLIAILALVAVAAAGLWAGDVRVQALEQGAARQEIAAQNALWNAVVGGRLDQLDAAKLLLGGRLTMDGSAEAKLEAVYTELSGRFGLSRIEVFATDGAALFRTPATRGAITASAGNYQGRGIGQNESRGYVLYSSLNLGYATAVLSVPMERALTAFTATRGGQAALLDLRGAPIALLGTETLGPFVRDLPTLGEAAYRATYQGQPADIVSTFVNDALGRPLAQLVSVTTVTAPPLLTSRPSLVAALAAATLAIASLLAWYVRSALAPVEAAVASLEQLADGDTAISLPAVIETDESGRLVAAARALRARALTFLSLRIARERQGRRQQRFIRMQMEALANMLEPDARDSVLADLARLETAARQVAGARRATADEEAGEDFGVLAAAFQNMAIRVRDQYAALGALVRELSEALKAKNDYVALQKELEIARRLQLSILPHSFRPRDGLSIQSLMTPAKEVGGDFYDFFEIDERRIGVVVADVSGKGVPAALFMAVSRTLLRAIGLLGDSPGRVLARLNDLLAAENEEMMFVTVFYAVIEPDSGKLTYANGGHNRPVRLSADGSVDMLPGTKGTALAVMAGLEYAEATITLGDGECLLLYTDGVTEAFDVDGQEFTDHRLLETMAGFGTTSTHDVPQAVTDSVYRFARGAPQSDDITCVAIGYRRDD
jgi:sigma-B regulation protein RsbU (phosphoserine phosphatase)